MEEIELLEEKMRCTDIVLFLGAGFSFGAERKDKKPVPLGNELKNMIISDYLKLDDNNPNYKELIKYDLSSLCEYSINETCSENFSDFLTNIFKDTIPNEFHYDLCLYPWSKIYTTNIDDIVEKIYDKAQMNLHVQNRKDKIERFQRGNFIEFIKLHGCTHNPSEGYIFSTNEYIDSMQNSLDYRFNSLIMDMQRKSFIVIGSEFDEINLDFFIRLYEKNGISSLKGDIFFINPSPSLKLKSKIRSIKGYLIEWDTRKFLNFINEKKIYGKSTDIENRELMRNKFYTSEYLKNDLKISKIHYKSKLYFGFEAEWEDIFYDFDFLLPQIQETVNYIEKIEKSFSINFYGSVFSGKSTFIKRLFKELSNKNYFTLFFFGQKINKYFIEDYISNKKKSIIIIIDDGFDCYSVINDILNHDYNQKIIFITSSRTYMHIKKRHLLPRDKCNEIKFCVNFNNEVCTNISNKLEEIGLLGAYKKYVKEQRIEELIKKQDLLNLLFGISNSERIKDRIFEHINDFKKRSTQRDSFTFDLLLKLSIFDLTDISHFDISLLPCVKFIDKNINFYTVDQILNRQELIDDKIIEEIIEGESLYTYNPRNMQLKIKNNFIAKNIIELCTKEEILSAIKEILIYISPQITEFEYDYYKSIFEALGRFKKLSKQFHFTPEKVQHLLDSIKQNYKNTSFFWLQLALIEQEKGDYDLAHNHILQAEALHPGSYQIMHAKGRNFLCIANNINIVSTAYAYFEEGEKILLNLIQKEKKRKNPEYLSYSIHSYLHEKLIFLQRFNPQFEDISNDELRRDFRMLKECIINDKKDVMLNKLFIRFKNILKSLNRENIISINHGEEYLLSLLSEDEGFELDYVERYY